MALFGLIKDKTAEGTAVNAAVTATQKAALLRGLLWFLAIGGILGIIYYNYRQRTIYRYKAHIERRRADGKRKIIKGRCGYIKDKGVTTFIIKWGWKPTNRKKLDYLPDTKYLEEDTFYFDQLDPETYVQKKIIRTPDTQKVKQVELLIDYEGYKKGDIIQVVDTLAETLVTENKAKNYGDGAVREVEASTISYEPIPRENKIVFVTYAKGVQGALNVDAKKVMTMFIVGMIVLALTILGAIAIIR